MKFNHEVYEWACAQRFRRFTMRDMIKRFDLLHDEAVEIITDMVENGVAVKAFRGRREVHNVYEAIPNTPNLQKMAPRHFAHYTGDVLPYECMPLIRLGTDE